MVIMVMMVRMMMMIIMIKMLVVVVVVKPTYPSRLRSSHSSGSPARLLSLATRTLSVFSRRKLTALILFFLALLKKRVSLCLLEKINFFCCHLRLITPMPQYLSLDPCCGFQHHSACSIPIYNCESHFYGAL